MPHPAIRLDCVCKSFGDVRAVDRLNLEIAPSEIYGFLGPNGAGKTTVNRMLAGLLAPDEGKLWINGIDVVAEATRAKKQMGFIPDRPFVYDKLTAQELMEFVGGLHGLQASKLREQTASWLERLGLAGRGGDLLETYSHGMRQRLVMAAAMLHAPAVLIVDEPIVGLDPHGVKKLKEIFLDLRREGRAIFMSTHSLPLAQEICDRIGILHAGKLVAQGDVNEVIRRRSDSASLEEVFLELTGS